jgi:hypothetical protein
MVYDPSLKRITQDIAASPLGAAGATAANLFPPPPGIDEYRARRAAEAERRRERQESFKEGSGDRKR